MAVKEIKPHYRTYVLRDGTVVRKAIGHHTRNEGNGKDTHLATTGLMIPEYQRDMEERMRGNIEDATERAFGNDAYIAPEEYTGESIMRYEKQRKFLAVRGLLEVVDVNPASPRGT